MAIISGLGGPKANPKGVADGQPVNIPALLPVTPGSDGASAAARVIGFTSALIRRSPMANPWRLNVEERRDSRTSLRSVNSSAKRKTKKAKQQPKTQIF